MNVHFNDTRPANASAETLFEVITDYANYPSFNSALINVNVVRKDESGAEFVSDRRTRIGKKVRAFDRYERNGDLVVERTYERSESARSTWTIHPIDDSHCTLNIDASQSMGPVRGIVMKPALKHLFYGINFAPFIHEGSRARSEGVRNAHQRLRRRRCVSMPACNSSSSGQLLRLAPPGSHNHHPHHVEAEGPTDDRPADCDEGRVEGCAESQ